MGDAVCSSEEQDADRELRLCPGGFRRKLDWKAFRSHSGNKLNTFCPYPEAL